VNYHHSSGRLLYDDTIGDKMKIVQVIHGFPPYSKAGSEIYTHNLSVELAKQDEVFVFYRIANPDRPQFEINSTIKNGLNLYSINNKLKGNEEFELSYRNDSISKLFAQFLEDIKPDIVHFQHLLWLSTTLVREAKKKNIPTIFTLHDFWLFCHVGQLLKIDLSLCSGPDQLKCTNCLPPKMVMGRSCNSALNLMKLFNLIFRSKALKEKIFSSFNRYYSRIFYFNRKKSLHIIKRNSCIKELCSHVDLFVSPSLFFLMKFEGFGIPKAKIVYLPNGHDITLFNKFSKKKSKKLRFGYIGTFLRSKGIHVLINAFNQITEENVELRVHGMPCNNRQGLIDDYPGYLKSLVKRDNVLWFGEYDNKSISNILSEIDVLIVPSVWYENAPLTIQEAFMASIPVIASNMGGMKELVCEGKNGLMFRPGDSNDLAKKMQLIIDHPNLIGKLQKDTGSVMPIDTHVKKMRKLYSSLI
jgi:glycosyltransferase involved in cell wall biosynthesis